MLSKAQKAEALKQSVEIIKAYAPNADSKDIPTLLDKVYKKMLKLIEDANNVET